MEIKDLLEKSFSIANDVKFNVRIIENSIPVNNEWSYLQLGLFLVNKSQDIEIIEVHIKNEIN